MYPLREYSDRYIASDIDLPVGLDELLSIKSTGVIHDKDFTQIYSAFLETRGVKLEFIEDPQMPKTEAYKIIPLVENQTYKLRIMHSLSAKGDAPANLELVGLMMKYADGLVPSQYSIFELYYNAQMKDFQSFQVMAKFRKATLDDILKSPLAPHLSESIKKWDEVNSILEGQERLFNKKVKAQENARKIIIDALDNVPDDQQLRTLVARNDRKGASELIRKYLPWEKMPPFEKLFWENYLAVMADPLPYDKRVFIYRGLKDDVIYTAEKDGKKLGKTEAIKEQQVFAMAPLMSKNQGPWNRRLRSLVSMYDKYIATSYQGSNSLTRGARISTMFFNHSREPKGSPFLSLTPHFSIAKNFGATRTAAYFIDPRLLSFNYASNFYNEAEFLLPLVTFPDELAAIWDAELHPAETEVFLKEHSALKLKEMYGENQGKIIHDSIIENSRKFFSPVMDRTEVYGAVVAKGAEEKAPNLFKKILGMTTDQASTKINAESDMPCTDLIQLFWK